MLHDGKAYLSNSDISEVYEKVKGSDKGINAFIKDAQRVASKSKANAYIYKDEMALYYVFEKHLGKELAQIGVDSFGKLMQYIS